MTLKKSGGADAAGWGSWVPLISIFGIPCWARLINILLCETHFCRLGFGTLVEEGFESEGWQTEGTEGPCGLLCPELWWLWSEQTFCQQNWNVLCLGRRNSQSWHAQLLKTGSVLNLHQALISPLFSCK